MKIFDGLILYKKLAKVHGLNGFNTRIKVQKNISALQKALDPYSKVEQEDLLKMKDFNKDVKFLQRDYPGEENQSVYNKKYKELLDKHKKSLTEYEALSEKFIRECQTKDLKCSLILIPLSDIEKYEMEIPGEKPGEVLRPSISDENLEALWQIIDQTK